MLNENIADLTESMVAKVVQRIRDHIFCVQYFYNLMINAGIIPEEYIRMEEVKEHDADKLEPHNLERQALRYCIPEEEMTEEDLTDIDNVVREHIKNNPHHCEYWGDGDQHTKGMDCSNMPVEELFVMMADWTATSEEKKGENAWNWYYNSVVNVGGDRWKFTDEQIEIIESCLKFLEDKIDPILKRDYGLSSFDPAKKSN